MTGPPAAEAARGPVHRARDLGTQALSLQVSDGVRISVRAPIPRSCVLPWEGRQTRLSAYSDVHALPVLLGRCPTRWPTLPRGQTRRRNRRQTAPSSDRLLNRSRSSRDARPGTLPGRTITLHPHERNPGAPPIMNDGVMGDFDGRRIVKARCCGNRMNSAANAYPVPGTTPRVQHPTKPAINTPATPPRAGTSRTSASGSRCWRRAACSPGRS